MEEWEDDKCCATCRNGELVQDNDEGDMVHCKLSREYVATDYLCPEYMD